MELQEQSGKITRDLRQVVQRLAVSQRELRANQAMTKQISELAPETTTYRSVGRCFMLTPREQVDSLAATEFENLSKNISDLTDRKLYLERRLESIRQHLKDIMS